MTGQLPKRVILESPFAGDFERNRRYAKMCMMHSLFQGEAPFASHLIYGQKGILNDEIPFERELGIIAGFAWHQSAEACVVYTDIGISEGMHRGIANAHALGLDVDYRICPEWNRLANPEFDPKPAKLELVT